MEATTGLTGGRTIGIILSPTSVRLAQTLGLTLSSYAVGQTISQSIFTVPALLRLPTPALLSEARRLGTSNKTTHLLTAISAIASAWLEYREPTSRTQASRLYIASVVFLVTSALWSTLAVRSLERELNSRAVDVDGVDSETLKWIEDGGNMPVQKDEYQGMRGTFRRWMGTGNDLFFPILKSSQLSVRELVDRWALLNLGTGIAIAAGSVTMCWAVVSGDTSIFE